MSAIALALAAAAMLGVAVRRPPLACALLILLVPLTTGLARGVAVPLLKPSEALTAVVIAGVAAQRLTRRRTQELSGLDLAAFGFALVGAGVPAAVLLFSAAPAGPETWRVVLAPAQLLAVYLLFSRTPFGERDVRLVLGLAMAADALVGAVAVAEVLDLPGLRSAIAAAYPSAPRPAWDLTYRPDSLAGHYSAAGGLCLFGFILAFALAAEGRSRIPPRLLGLAMLANLLGVVASETFAPFLLLAPAAAALALAYRRLPRELPAAAATLGAGLVVLWPSLSGRVVDQGLLAGGAPTLAFPESMQTRMRFWSEYIWPALQDHLWLGTGTVVPGSVPGPLADYVDNEYLWAGFRAGLPGISVLLVLLGAVAVAGWSERRDPSPARRTVGPAAAVAAVALLLLGITAQYLTFGGLVQEFGMLAGLLAGLRARRPQPSGALVLGAGLGRRPSGADPHPAEDAHSRPGPGFLGSAAGWLWSRTRQQLT